EPLLQARGELGQLHEVLASLAGDRRAAAEARSAAEAADAEVTAAEETLRQRRETLEELRRAHVIAGLRPHLVAGEPCPLCEQTVAALPADSAGPGSEGTAARAAMEEADRVLKRAQAIARSASSKAARADSALESGLVRGTTLLEALARTLDGPLAGAPLPAARELISVRAAAGPRPADAPSPADAPAAASAAGKALAGIDSRLMIRVRDELGALLQQRAEAERAADQAAKAAEAARATHRQAQTRRDQADADLTAARNALRAARDPLVRFGAPLAEDDASLALARAGKELSEWAAGQARDRAAALADAQRQAREAAGEHTERAEEFRAAERALAGLRDQSKRAAAEEQQASARLTHVTGRVSELNGLLEGAPDEEQITAQLAELDRRKAEADQAAAVLQRARAARGTAESALTGRERSAHQARAALSAARDGVVGLGAPAIDGSVGLLDGWTMLVTWAGDQATARDRLVEEVIGEAGAAREETARLTGQLIADLGGAGIVLGSGASAGDGDGAGAVAADAQAIIDGAQAAVAKERERARAAVDRIRERRAAAAEQLGKQQAALDEQRVARMLGDLLRADHFQRWLVTAALDDLVTHASRTLVALSSGQFDLTYDGGDFYVIDHADADTRRSVRTLSGGETFLASLALALALSSQISALAAAGAARLDSIFLDEGFGTLDSETLEVVATTLETLAQGDRMVGVVTHVGALAERVPVRFRVSRNARTSVVTREGPDVTPDDATEDAFPS
ncbi:MAG TPA: SbcC/MukB-like Walker B domain-containing protein, partial [Trebonia sp.]|nr:SbcC/MukB-like Walker B domain-containing protein [Trebonia sp.]